MPRARITDPETGKIVIVSFEGDPPSPEEANDILLSVFGSGRVGSGDLPAALGGVGAIAGGLVGGIPGGLAGAGLGGALGEGIRQTQVPETVGLPGRRFRVESIPQQAFGGQMDVEGAPQGLQQRATTALARGGEELALETVGAGLGKGLQFAGRGFQRLAFDPSRKVLLEQPDVIERSLRQGASPGTVRQQRKAVRLRGQSRRQADALVDTEQARRGDAPISRSQAARRTQEQLGGQFTRQDVNTGTSSAKALQERVERFAGGPIPGIDDVVPPTDSMTLTEALATKRDLDQAADAAFRASQVGDRAQSADSLISKELSQDIRGQMEPLVPGLRKRNLETKGRAAVAEMVTDSLGKSPISQMGAGFLIGGGAGAALSGDPRVLAGTALSLPFTVPVVGSRVGRALFRGGQAARAFPSAVRAGRIAQPETGFTAADIVARTNEADELRRLLLEQLGGQSNVDALNVAARTSR